MNNKIIDIKTGKAKKIKTIYSNHSPIVDKKVKCEMNNIITSVVELIHRFEDSEFNSQTISIGLLHTVFDYVMQVAPNKEIAYDTIIKCLESCKDEY